MPPVRALLLRDWGASPEPAEVPEPEPADGACLVRVRATTMNPVDLAIAAGRFYMPVGEPPFVTGAEAVGEVIASSRHAPGTRVWCLTMTGAHAETALAPEGRAVPVPDGLSDEMAAAVGIAGLAGWISVYGRGGLRPDEVVVVLGAGGLVGQVAIQAARLAGADRIVGVARSAEGRERAMAVGADLTLSTGPDLAEALRTGCPDGVDLVVDALWGESAAAALGALRHGGRLVQVGNAQSPTAQLAAGPMRGGRHDVRGFSVFTEDEEERAAAYAALAEAARAGDVEVPMEVVPLADGIGAWRRQGEGTDGHKLVLRV